MSALTQRTLHNLQPVLFRIERLIGQYEGMHQPVPGPGLERRILVNAVTATLQLHGVGMHAEQVAAVLDGNERGNRDLREVYNLARAFQQLHRWKATNPDHVLALHAVLLDGLNPAAGRWPGGHAPAVMESLEHDINRAHPIVAAAQLRHDIEHDEVFKEGNDYVAHLWSRVVLMHYHPVFAWTVVERAILARQAAYNHALQSRRMSADEFVAIVLEATLEALEETLHLLRGAAVSDEDRLATAHQHFGRRTFTRKDYRALFPALSAPTASRDLRAGVDEGMLESTGEKSLTTYRFQK